MTIPNSTSKGNSFIERGNPEDMPEETMDTGEPKNTQKTSKVLVSRSKSSQNYLIVAIILVTVLASFVLGLLEGSNEKDTDSTGLVSSTPLNHSDSAKITGSSELNIK